MSNGVAKVLVTVVAAAIGFAAAQYGWQKYKDHLVQQSVQDENDKLRAIAAKDNPNAPTSEAMKQAAIKDSANTLNNSASDADKRNNAAGTFFGFYMMNARARPEYCKNLGVDIHAFTDPFIGNHAKLMDASRPVMEKDGLDENKLYEMLKPQIASALDQDMKDIANSAHTDIKGACQLMADRGSEIAGKMQFSATFPEAYKVLMPAG